MFNKHWKKFALATAALFWSGCSDDSSSNNPSTGNEPIACTLQSYTYDTIECGHSTTTNNNFNCDDGFECHQTPECDSKIYCSDKQGQSISYTTEEFDIKYFIQKRNF